MSALGPSNERELRAHAMMKEYHRFELLMRELYESLLLFDTDKTGTLNAEETFAFFCEVHAEIMNEVPESTRSEFFEKMFTMADANQNGELDFCEFVEFYNHTMELRKQYGLGDLPDGFIQKRIDAFIVSRRRKGVQMVKSHSLEKKTKTGVPIKKKLGYLDRNERKALTLMGDAQIAFELYAMFKRADEGKTGKVRHELLEEELIKDGRFANKVMRVSKLRELRSYGHSELTLREFMRMLLPHATTTTIERYVSNSKHLMAERAKGADVHSDLYETIRRKGRCGTSVDLPEKMELLRMFALYDEDKNKLLDRDEFVECVKPMYERTLAVELFEIVDVDKSGSINPWEFLAFFTLAGDIIDENDYCMYLLGSLDKTYHDDGSKLSELLSEEDKVSGPAA